MDNMEQCKSGHSTLPVSNPGEMYKGFFENNYAVMLLIDPADGVIKDANRSAVNFYGYPKEKLLAMNIQDLNTLSPEQIRCEMEAAKQQERNYFNFQHRLSDGKTADVEVFSGPVMLNGSEYLFSLIIDASYKAKSEKALRESEEKYRKLIELSPDMIYVQTEGRFVLINPAGVKLLGAASEKDIIGRNILDLVHPDDYEAVKSRIRINNLEKAEVPLRESRYKRLDGTFIWVEVAAKPIDYQEKSGALVVARDISDRKKSEERLRLTVNELERSNEELEQFAYVSSHDLQEPLRMVTSYVQLFSRKFRGHIDPRADEYLNIIVDSTKRMQSLIKDLLLIARVSNKSHPFVKTDFNSVLSDLLKDLQFVISDNRAVIKCDKLPVLNANPVQIRQLFQNLLSNAVKFRSEDEPFIEIKAEAGKNEWIFSVKDNGIGIAPEYFPKIFMIFQKLQARDEYPGTGIGLTICKKIVERHGGRIWVESKPGHGSTFFFTLPMH